MFIAIICAFQCDFIPYTFKSWPLFPCDYDVVVAMAAGLSTQKKKNTVGVKTNNELVLKNVFVVQVRCSINSIANEPKLF